MIEFFFLSKYSKSSRAGPCVSSPALCALGASNWRHLIQRFNLYGHAWKARLSFSQLYNCSNILCSNFEMMPPEDP